MHMKKSYLHFCTLIDLFGFPTSIYTCQLCATGFVLSFNVEYFKISLAFDAFDYCKAQTIKFSVGFFWEIHVNCPNPGWRPGNPLFQWLILESAVEEMMPQDKNSSFSPYELGFCVLDCKTAFNLSIVNEPRAVRFLESVLSNSSFQ